MHYKKLILVTDTSRNSRAAGQTALDLAQQHSAKLIVVDSVHRPSTISRLVSGNADDLFELVVNQKQERLDQYANKFFEAETKVETRLLVGNSSEEISRLAIEESADLVIRYMKGQGSRRSGPVGTTARNLMRVCPAPLLLVADDKPLRNPRVLSCVNAEHRQAENEAIITEARKLAGADDRWQLLYGWYFYGNEYIAAYINDEMMNHYLADAEQNSRSVFDKFLKQNGLSFDDERVFMEEGDPIQLIPKFCHERNVDVVVMSSASQNHPLHRLLGSTVESLLDNLPCALLVVKPTGFESPIKPLRANAATE